MNIKSVIKVMNFHALLRVDRSRKQADKYAAMEEALVDMMTIIYNNANLQLDRTFKVPSADKPVLRIYLGSDLGFCGNINSSVSGVLRTDDVKKRIVVGKKLKNVKEVSLRLTEEEFREDFTEVQKYLTEAVLKAAYSSVEVVYNHYYNISSIKLETKKLYPIEPQKKKIDKDSWVDYLFEGDIAEVLSEMMLSYLTYQLKIAAVSAYAAENIMRQNATTDSLKKLDEKEEEDFKAERKKRTQIAVSKSIDNYTKQKAAERTKK